MKKSLKRAFSIIELVIVIAIVAILAAVLIPTFSSVVQRSKMSSDQMNVRNFNTVLSGELADPPQSIQEVRAVLEESGYTLPSLPVSNGYRYVWDRANNCTYLVKEGSVEIVYPEGVELTEVNVAELVDFSTFAIVGTEVKKDGTGTYSVDTANDWAWMVDNLNSGKVAEDAKISLTGTLDLSGTDIAPVTVFKGTLKGENNATIEGLTLTSPDAEYVYDNYYKTPIGLISVLDGGTVENIKFTNVNINCPGGDKYYGVEDEEAAVIGTVAGVVTGTSKISGVTVESGTIVTQVRGGGIVGAVHAGKKPNAGDTVTIKSCENHASITTNWKTGSHGTTGGIIGFVHGSVIGTVVLEGNTNYGEVNGYTAGGIMAHANLGNTGNIKFTNNTNHAAINAIAVGGGILGESNASIFRGNKNYGAVKVEGVVTFGTEPDDTLVACAGGIAGNLGNNSGNQKGHDLAAASDNEANVNYGAVAYTGSSEISAITNVNVAVGGVIGIINNGRYRKENTTTIQYVKNAPASENAAYPTVTCTITDDDLSGKAGSYGVGNLIGYMRQGATLDGANVDWDKIDASVCAIGTMAGSVNITWKNYSTGEQTDYPIITYTTLKNMDDTAIGASAIGRVKAGYNVDARLGESVAFENVKLKAINVAASIVAENSKRPVMKFSGNTYIEKITLAGKVHTNTSMMFIGGTENNEHSGNVVGKIYTALTNNEGGKTNMHLAFAAGVKFGTLDCTENYESMANNDGATVDILGALKTNGKENVYSDYNISKTVKLLSSTSDPWKSYTYAELTGDTTSSESTSG